MAYGFVITAGDSPRRLDDALHKLIAEVRVEQDMSRPTKFAVRFEEDICQGDRIALSATAIQPGEKIAVLVPDENDALVCLVMGQVTKFKSSAVTGGPGSWLEVHGEDLRAQWGRESITATWTGSASDIAGAVFALHEVDADVKPADTPTFGTDEGQRSHNQSSPDLQLLDNLARMLGYEFWFTYSASAAGSSYTLVPTAKFRPSPDYDSAGAGSLPAMPTIDLLAPSGGKTLRLDVAQGCCRNISSFRLDVDVEKATTALIGGQDDQTGEADSDDANDPRPADDPMADLTIASFGCERHISHPDAGSSAEQTSQAQATLADEGWFVTAAASTSAHLLPGVVQSHDIVAVEGNGFRHSGRYHVSKVVHVVNAWGHLMDLTLRRNALPSAPHVGL